MHELTLAAEILEATAAKLRELDGAGTGSRGGTLRVRVGEFSGVSAEGLRFCLEAGREGTPLAEVRVEVERVRPRLLCPECGAVDGPGGFELACPRCSRAVSGFAGGRELEVEFESDEPEGSGSG